MAQIIERISGDNEMKAIDANRYATKKTIAQGMLDIALLTANASQLKYILQVGDQHQFYKLMLIMIISSIILQLLAGILFVIIGSLNINRKEDQTAAIILNDVILVVIFLISVINVIVSGFGIEYSSQPLRLVDQSHVSAGILLLVQSLLSIHTTSKQRSVAEALNHIITGTIYLSTFCDVIKMNFSFDVAVPVKQSDIENFEP